MFAGVIGTVRCQESASDVMSLHLAYTVHFVHSFAQTGCLRQWLNRRPGSPGLITRFFCFDALSFSAMSVRRQPLRLLAPLTKKAAAKRRRCGKKGKEFGEMGKKFGELGGVTNNEFMKERSLASTQACEKCGECGRSLTYAHFWPADWRRRTQKNRSIKCKECCPKPPQERLTGYMARNEQRSNEAAARPITCQACEQSFPRTQFPPNSSKGRFDFRKPQTCEQCRAEGKHPKSGPKRQRVE